MTRLLFNNKLQHIKFFTLERRTDIDGKTINGPGEGRTITVEMNHDGSLVNVSNVSKVRREITAKKAMARVKRHEQAYEEAVKQIQVPQATNLGAGILTAWKPLALSRGANRTSLSNLSLHQPL